MKGSYFPSIRTTNLVQPILGSQYSIGNTVTALRESYQTIPSALRAETSSRVQFDPPENQNWLTNDSYLSQKEKAIFFLCRSSFRSEFSDCRNNTGFGHKNVMYLHYPRKVRAGQRGLLSINFDFRNVIFQPMVFPFVWAKYKWKFMRDRCKLSFPRPLAALPLARAFSHGLLRSPK